jgi:hypothetical protein
MPPAERREGRFVASDKYLAVVGVSEEDTAHLRLLMRAVTAQLAHRWRWGTEDNADLIVIDPTELGGQIARNRAFSSGRRCVVMSESEPLRDGELRLDKPLKNEALVTLLNASSSTSSSTNASVTQFTNDFYDVDSFDADFELEDDEAANVRAHQREEHPALGLDELLKPDADAVKPMFAVPINLNEDTGLTYATSSARSENRHADSIMGLRKSDDKLEGINFGTRHGNATDTGMRPLRDYLAGSLLGGPSTVTLDGVPPLTLDPKEQHYTAPGKLRELAVYFRHDFARDAFKPITSQELARQRTENGVHPYARLVWLDVLTRSGGQLARHLDPGGRYRLKPQASPEKDFPKHVSIVAALQQLAKLNEIAATARVSMADVFDVVNAYDAIGLIEMERRQPRHAEPEQPAGLLARLKKPFGR